MVRFQMVVAVLALGSSPSIHATDSFTIIGTVTPTPMATSFKIVPPPTTLSPVTPIPAPTTQVPTLSPKTLAPATKSTKKKRTRFVRRLLEQPTHKVPLGLEDYD